MAKRRKKIIGRESWPIAVTILTACDGASGDPNSKKITLYGIFDVIYVDSFPSKCTFTVVAKISGARGKHKVELDLIGPDGKPPFRENPGVDIESEDNAQMIVTLGNLPVKKAGILQIRLRVDGKILGNICRVRIAKRDKQHD